MIELRDVRKVYGTPQGEVVALDGMSLTVAAGETVCVIGTSGCGKTTALKVVNRLVEPTSGGVCVGGVDVTALEPIRLRRSIGYVTQSGGLFPHLTVAKNIGLLCALEGWAAARTAARVSALLELVGLPPATFAGRYPRELSGGQRQRVGVARALALDPAYVLMDEPFGALDPITRGQLHAEFRQWVARVRKTILLVTHDLAEAFLLGDRVALLDRGKVVQVGTEEDLRERPATPFVTSFLGGARAPGV